MLEFGFYEREITPPLGCNMPGYGNVRGGMDVKDRLYARAAVIKEGEGGQIMADKLLKMGKKL